MKQITVLELEDIKPGLLLKHTTKQNIFILVVQLGNDDSYMILGYNNNLFKAWTIDTQKTATASDLLKFLNYHYMGNSYVFEKYLNGQHPAELDNLIKGGL